MTTAAILAVALPVLAFAVRALIEDIREQRREQRRQERDR